MSQKINFKLNDTFRRERLEIENKLTQEGLIRARQRVKEKISWPPFSKKLKLTDADKAFLKSKKHSENFLLQLHLLETKPK